LVSTRWLSVRLTLSRRLSSEKRSYCRRPRMSMRVSVHIWKTCVLKENGCECRSTIRSAMPGAEDCSAVRISKKHSLFQQQEKCHLAFLRICRYQQSRDEQKGLSRLNGSYSGISMNSLSKKSGETNAIQASGVPFTGTTSLLSVCTVRSYTSLKTQRSLTFFTLTGTWPLGRCLGYIDTETSYR